jgi:hypothetical protein
MNLVLLLFLVQLGPWLVSSAYILDTVGAPSYPGYNGALTVVQILVHSHFDIASSVLALDETEKVSQAVTERAVELINVRLI